MCSDVQNGLQQRVEEAMEDELGVLDPEPLLPDLLSGQEIQLPVSPVIPDKE